MGKGQESRLASHLVQYQHMASMAGPGLAAYSLTTSGKRRLSVLVIDHNCITASGSNGHQLLAA